MGGVIYLVVLGVAAIGLIVVATADWRIGVGVLGAGLLIAAAGRLALGEHESGMLRVRGKTFDVITLSGLGVLLIVLALVIPNQPPL